MDSLIKSATIQVRVTPLVKAASEQVLWGIGLSMSEAVELFLRRIIVDTRIPFEIVALDPAQIEQRLIDADMRNTNDRSVMADRRSSRSVKTGDPAKEKIENLFQGGHTSSQIRARKRTKRRVN
jgi:addiction module RelB/DinJ family antitoxin